MFLNIKKKLKYLTLHHRLVKKITYRVNKFFNIRLSSAPYLSGDSFRKLADIRIDSIHDLNNFQQNKDFTVIFCVTDLLDLFIARVLPTIKHKFILITHNSDCATDSRHITLANNGLLIHWFAQNNSIRHKKITTIPIGLENRLYCNNGRTSDFKLIKKKSNKINKILCSFNIHTNPNIRQKAKTILIESGLADCIKTTPEAYKELLSRYAFVASPEGNGIDCHRTWEALYLGVIPIVTNPTFYGTFPDFPGLVLTEWNDLLNFDEATLSKAYETYSRKLPDAKFIWITYWTELINDLKKANCS